MRSLVKHLSILSSGEIIDSTARSTLEVLGVPPRIRSYGDCDVFVFDLWSRRREVPMYMMAQMCGYTTPEKVGSIGVWTNMHPSMAQYMAPAGHTSRWAYFMGHACHDYGGIDTRHKYDRWLLSRYVGGAVASGSVPQDFASPRTQKAARQWAINTVSPRRGLCTLGSSTLVVVIGDTNCLEEAGLSSDGKVEIATLLGLKAALSTLNLEDIAKSTPIEVRESSTVDLQQLPKALKFDGLMVPYRSCSNLREALLVGSLISHGYEDGALLSSPPNNSESEIYSWEFRRQIELYLQSYSWEVDRGMGHRKATAPMMLHRSQVPRHLLEVLDTSPLIRESAVDILQRTLKERKRNLGITFRTSGPKKAKERAFIAKRKEDNPSVSDILTDYSLWRASIDSLFGGVEPKYCTTEAFEQYQSVPALPDLPVIIDDSLEPEESRDIVPVINYLERAGLSRQAYPLYAHLLLAVSFCSNKCLGILNTLPSAKSTGRTRAMSLGADTSSTRGEQTSPYHLAVGALANCEHLMHPWVGRRLEEIATEHGLEHPPAVAALLERAREGDLLSKSQKLYDWYRLLAIECDLY